MKPPRLLVGSALALGLAAALFVLSPRLSPLLGQGGQVSGAATADDVDKLVDDMNAELQNLHQENLRRSKKAESRPSPSDQQVAVFQAEADKACLCTRRAGATGKDRCWANYERAVAQFKPERMGTMCIGANYWDFFAGDRSVTLQRAGEACTRDEEQAQLAQWLREGIIEAGSEAAGGCG